MATSHDGDVWVYEFARGVETRLTFDPAPEFSPQWSPDGSRITYAAQGESQTRFMEKPANGAGSATLFFQYTKADFFAPGDWSPDGRFLSVGAGAPAADAFILSAEGTAATRKLLPLVVGPFNERGIHFAPNGKYFAYLSNDTGTDEAYVRPFDPASGTVPGGQWVISKGGSAGNIQWRGDGKEIFYLAPDGTMKSVEIDMKSGFQPGTPKPLFKVPAAIRFWDVTSDGQKFLMPVPEKAAGLEPYRIVLNWTSTLKN